VTLQAHHKLISANVLRVIVKLGLIKMVDQNTGAIEHDTNRVAELSHNENLRVLKESKNDFLFDTEEAH
jgi:hypothetical protein